MKKYRTKKKAGKTTASCGMCKPHKHGWVDKFKPKERAQREALKEEAQNHE